MGWADFLLPAAAVAGTVLTAGAAAPAAAAALGGEAAGAGLAAGAAEAAAAAEAASAGTAAAMGAGTEMAAPALGTLGTGTAGAANPLAGVGSLAGGANAGLPLGMTQGALGTSQPLGTGLSGTGMFAEMPGASGALSAGPVSTSSGLTADQMGKLGRLMGNGDQQQQQPRAVSGGSTQGQATNRKQDFQALSTPGVGQRASLAQLLYGKH